MNTYLIIFGMMAATYIPRLLPMLFMDRFHFPAWFQNWLKSIPYAALGALIFPGLLKVQSGQPLPGLIGGLVAALLALFNVHIVLVMAGAILAAIFSQNIF